MQSRPVEVTTFDGICDAHLFTPEGEGPWPGVIMYPDAGGLRPTFDAMGAHLANAGYVVLVPNIYYRLGEFVPFDMQKVFTDEPERERLIGMVQSVSTDNITADTEAMLAFLSVLPEVASGKVGTTGYCLGGRISLSMAGKFPARIGATASFHGGGLATGAPDSPHLGAPAIQATVYVAGAKDDSGFDDAQRARLATALTDAGVDHTIETYSGLHGFAVPDNTKYDEACMRRHWQALESLYGSTLGVR